MTNAVIINLFSAFLAFMPIIGIYASPIPGFNAAEIVIMLFWIIFIAKRDLMIDRKYSVYILYFVVFLFVSFMISSFMGVSTNEILFRTIRFSLYYLTVCLWTSKYLDISVFFKWMRVIIYISFLFLLIQYAFFYLRGRVLLGFIPGLRIYQQVYETTDWVYKYTNYFRAASFFSEPAHLCQYYFIYLIYNLFFVRKINYTDLAVTLAGIILSTAGQGVVIGAIIIGLYFLTKAFENGRLIQKRQFAIYIILAIAVVVGAYFLSKTSVFQGTVNRLLSSGEQSSRYARLNIYNYLFDDMKGAILLFGRGFGYVPNENVFVPGLAYTIYGSGVIGLGISAIFMVKPMLCKNTFAKIVSIVFLILFIVSSLFMSLMGIIYLALMQYAYLHDEDLTFVKEGDQP